MADYNLRQIEEALELVSDLINLGYPHNFQLERSDIRDYMFKVSKLVKRAYEIKEEHDA